MENEPFGSDFSKCVKLFFAVYIYPEISCFKRMCMGLVSFGINVDFVIVFLPQFYAKFKYVIGHEFSFHI